MGQQDTQMKRKKERWIGRMANSRKNVTIGNSYERKKVVIGNLDNRKKVTIGNSNEGEKSVTILRRD